MPSPSITLEAYGRSEQGRSREINQDAFAVCPSLGLFVIADGMGGHPNGEIASAVAVEVDVRMEDARAGDVVLLCTDGLSNVVTDEEIARVLVGRSDIEATTAALVGIAEARGAHDDMTCIVLRWPAAAVLRPAAEAWI